MVGPRWSLSSCGAVERTNRSYSKRRSGADAVLPLSGPEPNRPATPASHRRNRSAQPIRWTRQNFFSWSRSWETSRSPTRRIPMQIVESKIPARLARRKGLHRRMRNDEIAAHNSRTLVGGPRAKGDNVSEIESRGYIHPEVLVSTEWVASHLDDPAIRIVESNEDPLLYSSGHLPGAVEVDWTRDLNDPVRRDYLGRDGFEALMRRIGATRNTTVVFYGDRNNWWATYAYWVFQLFGHDNAKVMDGGRIKWANEQRPLTRDVPSYPASDYQAPERDDRRIRAFRDEVLRHVESSRPLIDVRSPAEYTGERLHMPDY